VPNSPVITGLTDIGQIRKRNEDSISLRPEVGIAVVADGMGGHPGGDTASQIAADTVAALLEEARSAQESPADFIASFRETMTAAVRAAHGAIRTRGIDEPELEGMGTTLTAMVVDPLSDQYVLGHVGDSRAYLFRDGTLSQITRDDTWVQDRIDKGDIPLEAARRHPFGHLLTQCLGLEDAPVPQILDGAVKVGDAYLLCSDGLVGMLEDSEMERMLSDHLSTNGEAPPDGASVIEALLAAANKAGGHDNITAALVRIAAGS
jgi:serine/threonine protein phosphatase PrpC